jgi:hypothetical protein
MIRMTYSLEGGTVGGVEPGKVWPPTQTRWREDIVTLIDYTGRSARRCDGAPESGDMVIEYTRRSSSSVWTVVPRQDKGHEPRYQRRA